MELITNNSFWSILFEKTKSRLLNEAILIFIDRRIIDVFSGLIITTEAKHYKDFCINNLHTAIRREPRLMHNFKTFLLYLCMNYADSKTLLTRNVENGSVERYIIVTKLHCIKCKKHPILVILLFKDDCNIKSVYFKATPIENITSRSIDIISANIHNCEDKAFIKETMHMVIRLHELITTEQLNSVSNKLTLNFIDSIK